MTIFDHISSILFLKKKIVSNVEEESEFSPYLVNRWASMYSPSVASVSNVVNKYLQVFNNKKDLFNLFLAVFPKVQSKKITYFKRRKDDETDEIENLELIAKYREISKREVLDNIQTLKMLNTQLN